MLTSTSWGYPDSPNLNFSNRLVRTRMPGGVGGERLRPSPIPIWLADLSVRSFLLERLLVLF